MPQDASTIGNKVAENDRMRTMFYKVVEYYKNGYDSTYYRLDEFCGEGIDGVVVVTDRHRRSVVLEAELARTPKLAFDRFVAEARLKVEEKKEALKVALKALEK